MREANTSHSQCSWLKLTHHLYTIHSQILLYTHLNHIHQTEMNYSMIFIHIFNVMNSQISNITVTHTMAIIYTKSHACKQKQWPGKHVSLKHSPSKTDQQQHTPNSVSCAHRDTVVVWWLRLACFGHSWRALTKAFSWGLSRHGWHLSLSLTARPHLVFPSFYARSSIVSVSPVVLHN